MKLPYLYVNGQSAKRKRRTSSAVRSCSEVKHEMKHRNARLKSAFSLSLKNVT